MSFNLKLALDGLFMKADYVVGKDYSQFAVNRYLSKYKSYVEILQNILTLKLPNEAHYKYLKKNLPYGWPRKVELAKEESDPIIEYVMKFYDCSRRDAKDYIKYLSKEEIAEIKYYYEEE